MHCHWFGHGLPTDGPSCVGGSLVAYPSSAHLSHASASILGPFLAVIAEMLCIYGQGRGTTPPPARDTPVGPISSQIA